MAAAPPRLRQCPLFFFFSPVVALPLWLSAVGPPYTPGLPGGRQPLQRGQRGILLYSRPRHLLTPSPPILPVGAPLLHGGAAAGRGRPPHGSDCPSGVCGRCRRGGDREGAGGCERPAATPPLRRTAFGGVEDAGRVTGVRRAAGGRGEGRVAAPQPTTLRGRPLRRRRRPAVTAGVDSFRTGALRAARVAGTPVLQRLAGPAWCPVHITVRAARARGMPTGLSVPLCS